MFQGNDVVAILVAVLGSYARGATGLLYIKLKTLQDCLSHILILTVRAERTEPRNRRYPRRIYKLFSTKVSG